MGDYEIPRYCPHQKYDLLYHGRIDFETNTIECLGHGWKWDLETGKGINCSKTLNCEWKGN